MFWTGHGGVYPYFVASGKSSPNGTARLSTNLTTPGFASSYPDFPRMACFIGICTIMFEGMNILGSNFTLTNNYTYTGILYVDFYGDDLARMIIGIGAANYAQCTDTQISQGCTLCALSVGSPCLKCNTTANYVYDPVNQTCVAKVGYYLNDRFFPQLCLSAEPGCLVC